MAGPFIPETATFDPGVYQIQTTDPVIGGPNGISNLSPGQLADRTAFLLARAQDGALTYSADAGAANAYVAALPNVTFAALADGMEFRLRIANTNTGPSTFTPSNGSAPGLPANGAVGTSPVIAPLPILGGDLQPLQGGELVANGEATLRYTTALNNANGGAWVIVASAGGIQRGAAPAANDDGSGLATTGWAQSEIAASMTNLDLGPLATLSSVDLTSNVVTGVLPVLKGGTGTSALPPTNGFLVSNGSNYVSCAIAAGTGISISQTPNWFTFSADTAAIGSALEATLDGRYLQTADNLSDLTSITTAQTNLGIPTLLAGYAPLASPAFSGAPTAPTPAAGANSTAIATTAFVTSAIAAAIGSGGGSGPWTNNVQIINGATTLGPLASGTLLLIQSASASFNITVPTPSSVPAGTVLLFVNNLPPTPYVSHFSAPGQTLYQLGPGTTLTGVSTYSIAAGEAGFLISDGTARWYLLSNAEVTAAQFNNNSAVPATTAFVQRALGNYQTHVTYSTSTTLTAGNAGSLIEFTASNITLTLPVLGSSPRGVTLTFYNSAYTNCVVAANSGGGSFTNGATSVTLGPGDSLVVEANTTTWNIIGGSVFDAQSTAIQAAITTAIAPLQSALTVPVIDNFTGQFTQSNATYLFEAASAGATISLTTNGYTPALGDYVELVNLSGGNVTVTTSASFPFVGGGAGGSGNAVIPANARVTFEYVKASTWVIGGQFQ